MSIIDNCIQKLKNNNTEHRWGVGFFLTRS
jgi:hypothetical protein